MPPRGCLAAAVAALWLSGCCGDATWPVTSGTVPQPRPYGYTSVTVLPFYVDRHTPGNFDSEKRMHDILEEIQEAVQAELDDSPPAGRYPLWVVASTLEFEVPRPRALGLWSEGDFKLVLEVRFVDMQNRTVSKFMMSADEFDPSGPTLNNSNCPDDDEMARAVAGHLRDHYRRVR